MKTNGDSKQVSTLDELHAELVRYAKIFDATLDVVFPTVIDGAELRSSFRHKATGRLQRRLMSVAQSLNRLTKIASKVELNAISENSQSILALSRVLIELSDKLNYLVLSPDQESELKLRTLYFSLVGAVKHKKLHLTIAPDGANDQERQESLARIQKLIDKRKTELLAAGVENWAAFVNLGNR